MSLDELQGIRRDRTLLVELLEKLFLDLSRGVRDALLLIPVAVSLRVDNSSVNSD